MSSWSPTTSGLESLPRSAARHRVRVLGSRLGQRSGVVRYRWGGAARFPGGAVAGGAPGFVQSVGMHGNFEVVAPLTTGGLAHWWRDNGLPAQPWHGPTPFGAGTFSAAALVQNDNGHLEAVAVHGNQMCISAGCVERLARPDRAAGGGVSGQPGFVQANDGTFRSSLRSPRAGSVIGFATPPTIGPGRRRSAAPSSALRGSSRGASTRATSSWSRGSTAGSIITSPRRLRVGGPAGAGGRVVADRP